MKSLLNQVCSFNQKVWRNTPIINLGFNVFSDLIDDPVAWDLASEMVEHTYRLTRTESQYHAIDFVFTQPSSRPSRFGEGSFPIWYASLELETTFAETIYHWKRDILEDLLETFKKKRAQPIFTARSVFAVKCQGILVNLRGLESDHPWLVQPSPLDYQKTQDLGMQVLKGGAPGLIASSARRLHGTNLAIFNKTLLKSPSLAGDFLYEMDANGQAVNVFDYQTKKLVCAQKI